MRSTCCRRHISYFNGAGSDLRYATCSSGCAQTANWEKVTVDEGSAQMGLNNSLAIGPDGAIHISYYDRANDDLMYARCVSDCTKPWNWTKVRVATGPVGPYTSLALEASGRIHVSYFGDRTLSLRHLQERYRPRVPGLDPDRAGWQRPAPPRVVYLDHRTGRRGAHQLLR